MTTNYKGIRPALKVLCALLVALPVAAQTPFIPYAERSEFILAAPGALDAGLYGYVNPALLTYVERMENVFAWSTADDPLRLANQWGLFTAWPRLGFGMIRQQFAGRSVSEYRIGLGGGDRRFSVGLAAGWAGGRTDLFRRQNHFVLGGLWRPNPHLSIGATLTANHSTASREAALDLALRPLGDQRLTLFADYASAPRGSANFWSAGAALEVVPGLALTGRYFDNQTISFGLRLGLGAVGAQTQARFDRDGERTFATYALRLGSLQPNALHALFKPQPRYLELELSGPVRHRRYAFFDPSKTLVDLLALIERARRDPVVAGLAINASGLRINPEIAWELREKLRQFRADGKRVIIYIDRVRIFGYHFASVADYLVLDPAGMLTVEGYVAGQTYIKGALDKLGIGFEEWRFFKYKSAMESFAREDMSAADREQLQALLDDWYDLARNEIGTARALTPAAFDRLVDDYAVFLPQQALDAGLVDRLGRWDEIDAIIEELDANPRALTPAANYVRPADLRWGARKKIAIVYALGVCAMDTGIRGRVLVEDIAAACESADALVLRVDSPGGDILPSDLVAAAVQKCRGQKPVVVSQGFVAASGGYWISMYGDAIVAAPNTLTGSIGVISGWAYNKGFKEKLGLSTDRVQAGRHADLPFGLMLPLIGLDLPDRNLTAAEQTRMEHAIRAMYGHFVAKVASGRNMEPKAVEEIAQGRIWTGQRARELGLIDRIGGLDLAIELAIEMAGLPADEPVALLEYPEPELYPPDILRPQLLGVRAKSNPQLEHLRFRLEHNGLPLLLAPPAQLPGGWSYGEEYD